jgi:hypothetical protein
MPRDCPAVWCPSTTPPGRGSTSCVSVPVGPKGNVCVVKDASATAATQTSSFRLRVRDGRGGMSVLAAAAGSG